MHHKPEVSHYSHGSIEPIEFIRALGFETFNGFCTGNVIKYLTRWQHKDGLRDLLKARDYLNWLIEEAEAIESASASRPTIPAGSPLGSA